MKAGRLPEDHPLEQLARLAQRNKRYADTPEGRLIAEIQRELPAESKLGPPASLPRRWS